MSPCHDLIRMPYIYGVSIATSFVSYLWISLNELLSLVNDSCRKGKGKYPNHRLWHPQVNTVFNFKLKMNLVTTNLLY
jgi:hypothetical protein